MNAETCLRRARPADAGELLPLIEAFCLVDGHAFERPRIEAALAPLLQDDSRGLVWLIGEPAVGYAVVTWGYSLESGGRDALLDEVFVTERGQGLGTRAVRELLADLARRGISRVFLETESHNEQVRRFYRRLGFEAEDSIWMTCDVPK